MISWTEHARLVRSVIPAARHVEVPVDRASQQVIACDLIARTDIPRFSQSAMDGFAVRSADLIKPADLEVAWSDVFAGEQERRTLRARQAVRVMTGAPLPRGADTVVPFEEVTDWGDRVAIPAVSVPGRHVRSVGEDISAGRVVLPAGAILTPARLALAGVAGTRTVRVVQPLTVLVLATGTEVVPPGRRLRYGQVHDINGVLLAAAVAETGCRVVTVTPVPDDPARLLAVLREHRGEVDLVITAGGISAGRREVVKETLAGRGVKFGPVALKPGRPQGAGVADGLPVIALPGSPPATMVSFELFVRPALSAAIGRPNTWWRRTRRSVGRALRSPLMLEVRPAAITGSAAVPVTNGHAGLRDWLSADSFIVLREATTSVDAGMAVDVWMRTQ